VSSPSFGQLFSTALPVPSNQPVPQVYGQPLVSQGTLFISTDSNIVYGLNAQTGAINWTQTFGNPYRSADLGCPDLNPFMGVTGTPVIDQSTNIAYMFASQYLSGTTGNVGVFVHALNVATGAEQPGFPVQIQGNAQNDSTQTFNGRQERQRPGLLLLNGVVYAAFGAYCDISPWQGWVAGVSTAGKQTALWVTQAGPNKHNGGGIWNPGGALVSDGPNQILFSTGNGGANKGPIAGSSPPATLGESVVRLAVQSDGSLQPTDFFSPYDAQAIDGFDGDLSAGAPMGLPPQYFHTTQHPNMLVQIGKQGYVYILDLANLGGIGMGMGGGDAVVARLGPWGGTWSKPAVWPGDGGYLYVPTASNGNSAGGGTGKLNVMQYGLDGNGNPTLTLVAQSTDGFGYSSGAPVVTSNGTTSGTALVWMTWGPDSSGGGAQLRAYDAVPVNGAPNLRFSASIGTLSKFASPGVSGNRVYVGTRDGHVLAFGAPVTNVLTGSGVAFGSVNQGSTAQSTLTLTATAPVTISSASISAGPFSLGQPSPALPVTLATGGTLNIPVTFAPTSIGMFAATVSLSVSGTDGGASGVYNLSVTGSGRNPNGQLSAMPMSLSFGGTLVGGQIVDNVTFTNVGGAPLTISSVTAPNAPFSLSGVPAANTMLSPGASVVITATFAPTALGMYTDSFTVNSDGGNVTVNLSGSCLPPGHLQISPLSINFGTTSVGSTMTGTFTVSNTGGSDLTITKSKPPIMGQFNATSTLAEGSTLAAQTTVTETVQFTPTQVGAASDGWTINSDEMFPDGGSGLQVVQFSGVGANDLTTCGTAIALITNPTGSGNKSLAVIHDGVYPAVGTNNPAQQYDTYNGQTTRTEDWIGYQYGSTQTFGGMIFEDGMQFHDGGWFNSINVQVLQSGSWVNVPNVTFIPAYKGNDNVNFETYNISFPSITGTGIRLDGAPGGTSTFISVGELRVLDDGSFTDGGTCPQPDAGTGGGGTDSGTDAAGPPVSCAGINAGSATDLTSTGTAIALITSPTGSGSKSLATISDCVMPAVGSTNSTQQYDTYTGQTRTEDWIGYQFSSSQTFGSLVFQDGLQFGDGGWFTTLNVQVLQSGTWVTVPNVTVTPAYKGHDGVNFETYTLSFAAITGTGIRLDGAPGGSHTFISVGELRVFTPGMPIPDGGTSADAGVDAGTGADAGVDAGSGADAGVDAGVDAGTDAGVDTGGGGGPVSCPGINAGSATDLTSTGTAIALITNPTGGGSKSLATISDCVMPPVGSTSSSQQYDTYTGQTRTEDWIGYQFSSSQTFGSLVFQDGIQFGDGGWFTTLNVQVLQSGTWVTVPNVTVTPGYKGNDGINFETYILSFAAITGTGIRLDGAPGGSHTFISVGELRVFTPGMPIPDGGTSLDAGVDAAVDAGSDGGPVSCNGIDAGVGSDVTSTGTAIALITNPTGSGSKKLSVISDCVFPPVGSTSSKQQYDTYTGQTRTEDWIGYQFGSSQNFVALVFQDGMQFGDGGWFKSIQVQVLQSGSWVTVPNVTFTPAYKGNDKVNFETYNITFPAIAGTGIRLDGAPGGSATFISVGELRVFAQ
jgi:iron transport multicopper oxidase